MGYLFILRTPLVTACTYIIVRDVRHVKINNYVINHFKNLTISKIVKFLVRSHH